MTAVVIYVERERGRVVESVFITKDGAHVMSMSM